MRVGSVSASRSVSVLWLLIISCDVFAPCYSCVEAGFLVLPASVPQLRFCSGFSRENDRKHRLVVVLYGEPREEC